MNPAPSKYSWKMSGIEKICSLVLKYTNDIKLNKKKVRDETNL
jgi:hypothetical protein